MGLGNGLLIEGQLRAGDEKEMLDTTQLHGSDDRVRPLLRTGLGPPRLSAALLCLDHGSPLLYNLCLAVLKPG